jgi:hypothetical protein
LLADKDSEIERLKEERVGLQNRITNAELIIILSTHLLTKMLSASTEGGGTEVKCFYLKAEDGIVTGCEMDITRSNNNNTTIHFNQ